MELTGGAGDPRVPVGTLAVLLHLSRLRSEHIVAQRLAEKFPDEDSWLAFISDPVTVDEIDGFSEVLQDIRAGRMDSEVITPTLVANMVAPHMGRFMESIQLTAERLGVSHEDLLVALVTAQ